LLTDETARILFNTTNAVGKVVTLDNAYDLTVTAVVAKQPKNSSIVFDYLVPWKLQGSIYAETRSYENDWGNNSWQTFVQLNDNANAESVNARIKDVVLGHFAVIRPCRPPTHKSNCFQCRNGNYIQILKMEKMLVDTLNMSGCLAYWGLSYYLSLVSIL
jgi:hypothetical protein